MNLVQINYQSLVQSGVKTNDVIDQIQDLLEEFQSDFQANQAQADSDHASQQDAFDNTIESNTEALADQSARLAATQEQLASDTESRDETVADLEDSEEHLDEVKANIASADSANDEAIRVFREKVEDVDDAVEALD